MTGRVLLDVRGLRTRFGPPRGGLVAVDGVDLTLRRGRTTALVGESGSGKSATALSIMGLIEPPGRVIAGEILLDGRDLRTADEREMQTVRGARIGMVFQDPLTSLNPALTIGSQIAETILAHEPVSTAIANARAVELLERVGVSNAKARALDYPHHFSGGMRQRALIAAAIACRPDIIIADEPTTALDVTVQAQIFDLLRELQRDKGTAIILITHDMGAVSEMADRVIVMYAGRVIEQGTTQEVIANPQHPYTQGLIACLPELGSSQHEGRPELVEINGVVPSIWELGRGCAFRERCPQAHARCLEMPPLLAATDRATANASSTPHAAACWLLDEAPVTVETIAA